MVEALVAPRESRVWLALVEHDPVTAMLRFIDSWHGPLLASDGVSDEELAACSMPDALAALYRVAGRCPRVLTAQNCISSFDEWKSTVDRSGGGRMPFYLEHQGVFVASAAPSEPDPEVIFELDPKPIRARERLSGFLLQAVVFEALFGAPFQAEAISVDARARDAAIAPLSRLPLGAWPWPGDPGELWCGDGVLAFTNPNRDDWDLLIGARDRAVLNWLLSVDITWDSLDA